MAKKSYCQYCGLARALDVVGERWTLLIVRNLLLGSKRYSDLLEELPGITTNLLAKRMVELKKLGLVTQRTTPPPYSATVYELTSEGASLEPAIHALGAWGGRYLAGGPKQRDTINLGWGLFSLKRRYRGGLTGSLALISPHRRYTLRFSNERLSVRDDDVAPVDVVVHADEKTLARVLVGSDATALGQLTIQGQQSFFTRVLEAVRP